MLMGIMRAIRGSHQRPAYGCSNLFQTNLSLTGRLPATPSGLGIVISKFREKGIFFKYNMTLAGG